MGLITCVCFMYHIIIVSCSSYIDTGCWPNNIVPYEISGEFTKSQKQHIEDQISELHRVTCIRWVNVVKVSVNSSDYVHFDKIDGNMCQTVRFSLLDGTGIAIIQLADSCLYGNVMHEMLHVLGIDHEHQRADRDCYVTINHTEVYNDENVYLQFQFAIKPMRWLERFPYDKSSLMHYPGSTYMKSRSERWYAHEPLGNSKGELSFLDLWKLLYKFCHFPHYCDLFPQLCILMDDLEKGCAK